MRRFEFVFGRCQVVQKYKPGNQYIVWNTCNVILKLKKKHDFLVLKENMGQDVATVDKTIYSEEKVNSGNVLRNQYYGVWKSLGEP